MRSVDFPAGKSASANAEANGLSAKALFQFSQYFDFGDSFEFVVQGWLEHAHIENALTQRDRGRTRGNEFADDLRPRFNHLCFVQTLAESGSNLRDLPIQVQLRRRTMLKSPHSGFL